MNVPALIFWYPWVRLDAHQDPIKMKKNTNKIIAYFGLNLKRFYPIASLFDMLIDMGERIAGKQNGPILIIECPPGPTK